MSRSLTVLWALCCLLATSSGQWEPDVRMTENSSEEYTSPGNVWAVATGPGELVHLAYYGNQSGPTNYEVYYRRSTDGGASWGSEVPLTAAPLASQSPGIVRQDSTLYVAYMDFRAESNYEIFFQRSTDLGLTWTNEQRLTTAAGPSRNPALAASGDNVYVAWDDQRPSPCQIYFRRSTDRGLTWIPETVLVAENGNAMAFPALAAEDSFVHCAFIDWRFAGRNTEIGYKRSTDFGVTWSPDIRLTDADSFSYAPCVVLAGANVHLAWYDRRFGDYEVMSKRSPDRGATWTNDRRVTTTWGFSQDPSLAVSGETLHVTWAENWGDWEIYYSRSTDNGVTWSDSLRLTHATGRSYYASIACSGPALHVVWHDDRDGNREIYYKRNPGGTGIAERREPPAVPLSSPGPAIVRAVLRTGDRIPETGYRAELVDASGRKVMALESGENDVRQLAPGVYFVGPVSGTRRVAFRARKVIIE